MECAAAFSWSSMCECVFLISYPYFSLFTELDHLFYLQVAVVNGAITGALTNRPVL